MLHICSLETIKSQIFHNFPLWYNNIALAPLSQGPNVNHTYLPTMYLLTKIILLFHYCWLKYLRSVWLAFQIYVQKTKESYSRGFSTMAHIALCIRTVVSISMSVYIPLDQIIIVSHSYLFQCLKCIRNPPKNVSTHYVQLKLGSFQAHTFVWSQKLLSSLAHSIEFTFHCGKIHFECSFSHRH